MPQRLHHIDFIVRDLEAASESWSRVLGVEPEPRQELEHRGIELVRFRLGEIWLILVKPVRQDSPVMRFLEEHGEGFFHMGLLTGDIEREAARLEAAGVRLANREPRRGVEGWKLMDIALEETAGVMMQLVEEEG